MMRLIIARHGNTFDKGDTVLRVGARTDLSLSHSGREQARALGLELASRYTENVRITAGALRRQRETAEAVAAAYGTAPDAIGENAALSEIDYGADDGKPETEVLARVGEEAMRRWEEEALPPAGWHADPEAICAGWRAIAAQLKKGETLIAVTSNGTARFAPRALGVSDAPVKLKTGAYMVFTCENGVFRTETPPRRPGE